MSDWLSEIEEHVGEWQKHDHLSSTWFTEDVAMMARVIREMANVVRYIELDDGNAIIYAPEALIREMNNLSPDAKELLK